MKVMKQYVVDAFNLGNRNRGRHGNGYGRRYRDVSGRFETHDARFQARAALRQACGGADRQPVRLNALLCRKMRMAPASSAFVFCAGIRYNERMKNMSSNMEVRDDG